MKLTENKKISATAPWMLLVKDVRLLEHDASSQYKFNRFWAISWASTMLAIPFVPTLYGHAISALIIQEVSLWANFATHFGAMSAALAARNTTTTLSDTVATVQDINEGIDHVADTVDDLIQ